MESKRIRENKTGAKRRRLNKINDINFDIVDLRLSNTCNLGYVMRSGDSSFM